MNLHSEYPFWMIKEGIISSYPILQENRNPEVVVIGGGITGALVAHHLTELGISVDVIEKRHIGHGSTSASTSLLQYEIDVPLFKLIDLIGEPNAVRAYKLCAQAIDEIGDKASKFNNKADFEKQQSLFYASFDEHNNNFIKPEFEARKKHGFKVKLLNKTEIKKEYGFSASAAILSYEAGKINPYKMCHYLFDDIVKKGNAVFDSTEITEIKEENNGVFLRTSFGYEIKAKYVVVACGYESQKYLPINVTDFNSSYAIVSKPLDSKIPWNKNTLIWETRKPYLYMRSTSDNRILVGGFDENFFNTEARDSLIPQKRILLEQSFCNMFPEIPFQTDYAWAGTFGETEDGLPYIGSYDKERVLFAMGYGGNGITFSMVAAKILGDIVCKIPNPDEPIFSFKRIRNE